MNVKTFQKFELDFYFSRIYILKLYGYQIKDWSVEKSSKYLHLKITLDKKIDDPTKINILQWLCGDSAMRVMLNQKRIDAGIKHWNKLFQNKSKL